ncbi:MAG: M28 family peptidase [Sulfolobales archaeon]
MTLLDVVAGSVAEKNLVESLSKYLTLKNLSVDIASIEVLEWGEVECFIDNISCTAQPPIESANVSGVLGRDIVISSTTKDPDNVWVTYWLSVKRDASAVIFHDEYPYVRKRRIVVNEIPSYSFKTKMVAKRPAVHVPLSVLPKLKRERYVTISVKTFKRLSRGYVIDIITGDRLPKVAVITHHDRWLTGFRDNGVGVLTVLKLAEFLEKSKIPARLISFTAEEFGDPAERSFYWAYGSRVYSKKALNDSSLDLAIVIDTAYREPLSMDSVGILGLERSLRAVKTSESEIGIGYTDAVSMVDSGIPSVVLHNLDAIKPVYHSDVDTYPGRSVEAVVVKLVRAIANVIREYSEKRMDSLYRAYIERIRSVSPPDMRTRIEVTSDPIALSKCLTKYYTTVAIEGAYSDFSAELKLLTYSDMIRGVEAGRRYTILSSDIAVNPEDVDHLKKLARTMLEEAIRCSRTGYS